MKLLKKNITEVALKDKFTVGNPINWTVNFFDGREHTGVLRTGTIVKVNRVTVDVKLANGDVVRLNERDLWTAK